MKVQELVEKYNKNQRIDIAKTLDVKQYVGIELKKKMAKLVLDNCTTIVDGEVHINSVDRYILFTIAVIGLHTNLEFVHEEDDDYYGSIDDYDMLCESGLLTKIIDTFIDDYASCQEILNMMTADKMQNNMTIEKKIGKLLDEIQDTLKEGISNLTDKLNLDELASNLLGDQGNLLELRNLIK